MVERGDMTVLHEPFCNLRDFGETDAGARTFDSPQSLLAWLRDETHNMRVSLKDHPPTAYVRDGCARLRLWPGLAGGAGARLAEGRGVRLRTRT